MPRKPHNNPASQDVAGLPSTEAQEHIRAQASPLAMRFELVGCRYATTRQMPDQIIPQYVFHPPCPFGKTQPDQECRDCQFHTIMPVGADQWHKHRYHSYGMVIPLSEGQADAVIDAAREAGTDALSRPAWRTFYAAKQAEAEQAQEQRERAAELERRQMGSRASHHPNN